MGMCTPCAQGVPLMFRWCLLLLTVLGLAFVRPAWAQDSLDLKPQWRVGEQVRYLLTKTRTKTQGVKVVLRATSRTDAVFEVVEASAQGYVLKLVFGETSFDDPKMTEHPVVRRVNNISAGMSLLLEVDPQGSVRQVRNWQEIRARVEQLLEVLGRELRQGGQAAADVDKLLAQVASMFSSEEFVRQSSVREVQALFATLGQTYALGTPLEYETTLPNILGGDPVTGHGQFLLKSLDRKSGLAEIAWQQTVDPEDLTRSLGATSRSLAAKLGRPPPDGREVERMSIQDSGTFIMEVSTGWASSLTNTRRIDASGQSMAETLSMRRR